MSKQTLLDMTQDILSAMTSDQVNSITDSVESQQVARIVKRTYEDIISIRNEPGLKKMVKLTSLASTSTPSHLLIPDNVMSIDGSVVWYDIAGATDTKKNMSQLEFKYPLDFMILVNARDSSKSTIDIITDIDGRELLIQNDKAPQFWTSIDDTYIILDSYDNAVESTIQEHKTQAIVYEEPPWVHEDTFIPKLHAKEFAYLKAESMSVSFNEIRQASNPKAEQQSRRLRTWLSQQKHRQNNNLRYPDYGR